MAKKELCQQRLNASRVPTLNIFCCPIIVSLNCEPEQDRLTPSAPPPYDAPALHYEL